ncbi:MAG: hypothetical protein ACRCUX_09455, partial [Beijerinckiaceae bacterium]
GTMTGMRVGGLRVGGLRVQAGGEAHGSEESEGGGSRKFGFRDHKNVSGMDEGAPVMPGAAALDGK